MSSQSPILKSAGLGETFRLQTLIEQGANVNEPDSKGFTPLHAAVNGGYLDCVEILVKEGNANVNCRDRDGTTPLHIAASLRHLATVRFLLEAKANVNAQDNKGFPIHNCCEGGLQEGHDAGSRELHSGNAVSVVEALLQAGSNVNSKNKAGRTPLMLAVKSNDIKLVEALLKHNADKNAKDNLGMSVANFAEDKPAIRKLLGF